MLCISQIAREGSAVRLDEMQWLKKRLKLSVREISERSGVPQGTVRKIFDGTSVHPRAANLNDITEVLLAEEVEQKVSLAEYMSLNPDLYSLGDVSDGEEAICVAEEDWAASRSLLNNGIPADGSAVLRFTSKNPGDYTIDDLSELSRFSEGNLELIDGVIYDINMPKIIHQYVSGVVSFRLTQHIREKGGRCLCFTAPTGVRLGGEDDRKNFFIPDVLVVCDRDKVRTDSIVGAPDFVLEITSPSTKRKDETLKARAYREHGVREYWILDLKKKRLLIYVFEEDADMPLYILPLKGSCGLHIFGGEPTIDLDAIAAAIDEFGSGE